MYQTTFPELTNRITGEVVLPDSPAYNDLRNVMAGTGSPAMIVRPKNNEDVAEAIRFAHDNQLVLSIRSGGHSMLGLSTNDGGVVIDLSHFNTVDVIDPARRLVRIGAGARWGDVAQTLSEHGLAISSGDTNSVGVGGLTLGGGIGWLVRKVGLTIDNLEAAEIVTADGRALRVSEREHPDLFWALRGGGGNFGVVTAFEFRAYPLTTIYGGMVIYDLAELETALPRWAEVMRNAPEELNSTAVIFPGFGPEMPASLMIFVCYGGDNEAAANAAIQPLLELGTVKHQTVERKPYYAMLEDAHPPVGVKAVGDNGFVKSLTREVLSVLTANYGKPGSPMVQIRSVGGAMARVDPAATAFAHRDYEAFVMVATFVPVDIPQEQADRARQEAWKPVKPFASGAYINFLTDAGETSVATAYPAATYERLAQVKAAYDPDNVFNRNHNIRPNGRG